MGNLTCGTCYHLPELPLPGDTRRYCPMVGRIAGPVDDDSLACGDHSPRPAPESPGAGVAPERWCPVGCGAHEDPGPWHQRGCARWRETAPPARRPEVVPHHAADGTLRHYCTRDHCPDFTENTMVAACGSAGPRGQRCIKRVGHSEDGCAALDADGRELSGWSRSLARLATGSDATSPRPEVEGLPEETLAELERLLAALPGAPWRYEEQERGASSIEPNVMWFTDREFANAARAIVALRNAFPALARRRGALRKQILELIDES